MPPQLFSRHMFSLGLQDADENLYLTDRDPYRFQGFADNRIHTVVVGDTLHTLADRYFASSDLQNPADLWWVIADYQPEPILDPTLKLTVGRQLFVPSMRVLSEEIFSEARRQVS